MKKIFAILLLFIFSQNVNAQNDTLTLKIPNAKKKDISFPPCIRGAYIGDCIDSTYKQNDTLFVILRDSVAYFKERSGHIGAISIAGYPTGLRIVKMSIQDNFIHNFIALKTFGVVYSFRKIKSKDNTYIFFARREEDIDYSNKKIMDLKEIKDTYGIEIRH